MGELLQSCDEQFPGFLDYFQELLGGYFAIGPRSHPRVAEQMEEALRRLDPAVRQAELTRFAEAGIFSGQPLSNDSQIKAFWTSPLMSLYHRAIGYLPEPDSDLFGSIPPPLASVEELFASQQAFRTTPLGEGKDCTYWQGVLGVAAPELYLWPFLLGRETLHGLDLGCGWGRGALGMRDYSRLRMTGVDINADELEILRAQAAKAGLQEKVSAVEADITQLPFEADHFDFALSYVVLDLLSDSALGMALREVLRCLKPESPFYIDIPTDRFCEAMMLQRQTRRGFIDLLHGLEAHGKVFQLAFHDVRIPMQFTFAVLERDALPGLGQARRPSSLVAQVAARLKGERLPNSPGWRERLRSRKAPGRSAGLTTAQD